MQFNNSCCGAAKDDYITIIQHGPELIRFNGTRPSRPNNGDLNMATHAKTGMFHGAQTTLTLSGLMQPMTNAFARYRKGRQAAADAKTLMSYDDRQLADIGISRAEINAIVYGKLPSRV